MFLNMYTTSHLLILICGIISLPDVMSHDLSIIILLLLLLFTIFRPRGPLRWLDPGAFGTLGVGGGFALGAKLCRPDSDVWIIYGDGSLGYSVAEFDTYTRHKVRYHTAKLLLLIRASKFSDFKRLTYWNSLILAFS